MPDSQCKKYTEGVLHHVSLVVLQRFLTAPDGSGVNKMAWDRLSAVDLSNGFCTSYQRDDDTLQRMPQDPSTRVADSFAAQCCVAGRGAMGQSPRDLKALAGP